MRDDFPQSIVRVLAAQVGHRCANPDCERPTSGPALDDDKAINLGVAAHITAASEGGPRYDRSLTKEARRAASNGIWLCQACGKLIDSDPKQYTIENLRGWKKAAGEKAFASIATGNVTVPRGALAAFQLDDDDKAFLRSLTLPPEDDLETVASKLSGATQQDIAAFRGAKEWPPHTIALDMALARSDRTEAVTLAGLVNALTTSESVNFVSPPGTGKTTTLVQLAESILSGTDMVPALVPLGEWSDRREEFFAFVAQRNSFVSFRRQHFMQLAFHGRLVLLLDGWNELDPAARLAATRLVKALRRDFPLLSIVTSTRRHAIPTVGQNVEIQPLSEDQQIELAQALRGEEGIALLDQAWRLPGLRELASIPLYLNALILGTTGKMLPQTKEEILSSFVKQHEYPEKAEVLRKELLGFHADLLVGIAVEANRRATTLADADACRAISEVGARLIKEGVMQTPIQPVTALDLLVGAHSLVRPAGSGGVSFQHQQFQEWYASFEVERLMVQAASGSADARQSLRSGILNWLHWEESILFACERLSRASAAGVHAVASAVSETLAIDPILAAEMIYRSSPAVWDEIGAKTVAFATHWHQSENPDRSVRFMIASGRPEFAEHIWPLISAADNQVYLPAIRAARRFRPSALGPDAAKRLATLPDETRGDVISEIGARSGFEGLELAAALAKSETNPAIVVDILETLEFRRADRHICEVMTSAPDGVWDLLAQRKYPATLADAQLDARLVEMRRSLRLAITNPIQLIHAMLEDDQPAGAADEIVRIIEDPAFPVKDQHAEGAVDSAFKAHPTAVAGALVSRLGQGLELPFRAEELLANAPLIDEGPIAAAALDGTTPERLTRPISKIIGSATVGRLMDQFFALYEKFQDDRAAVSDADRKEYYRLKDSIVRSRDDAFLGAFYERAATDDPQRISLLGDILARRAPGDTSERLSVADEHRERLASIVDGWIATMLGSTDSNRHQFVEVVRAAGRVGDARFVAGLEKLLDRDLADWAKAREEHFKSGRGGMLTPDVTHSYTLQYRVTLAAIGSADAVEVLKRHLAHPQAGSDAAWALVDIWKRQNPSLKEKRFGGGNDFSDVREKRDARNQADGAVPATDFAEAIFAEVRKFAALDIGQDAHRHALALTKAGISVPYGVRRAELDQVLALPLPYSAKQGVLTAAALAGEIVSADALLAGLQELLEAGKNEPWRLEDNRGELMGWIELFPFSDRPDAVLGALDLLTPQQREPWRLRRLLSALANGPETEGLAILRELIRRDPSMKDEYDWFSAVLKNGSEASAQLLLGMAADGTITDGNGFSSWHLAQRFASFAGKYPSFSKLLLKCYEEKSHAIARDLIEATFVECPTPEIVLRIFDRYANEGKPFEGALSAAVRNLAVQRRAVEQWVGAYEEHSAPLADFRKQLFHMAWGTDHQAQLAEACLSYIDELRDEVGRPDGEPRHPDIESGKPWPKLSDT